MFYFKNSTYIKIRAQRAKSKNKVKALLLLLLLLASQSSRRAHLRKIFATPNFASTVRETPTPQPPKTWAAVNKQVMKMAIYHCEMQNISRSDGRSIVACAAYRAGEKLYCDTYGKEQDYTKKTGMNTPKFLPQLGQVLTC